MIRNAAKSAGSFGERVRVARQRLRTAEGRRWTQGDLAAAVGVERNTVSRWENSGVLPKDPAIVTKLGRTLRVDVPWLLRGAETDSDATAAEADVHERRGGRYGRAPAAPDTLSGAAVELIQCYVARLSGIGCTGEQVAGAEALLTGAARNGVASRPLIERGDDEVLADIDAAWDMIVRILRRDGIRA